MGAVLFANATATTRLGRRRRSPITHGSALVAFERSRLALAPFPLTAEELVENAAAIGPEHQHHTHQRASGHHTRRHRQGELFGELRLPSLDQERNDGAQEEQKPIEPVEYPGEAERCRRREIVLIFRE